jgi:hypothetical protein
MKSTRIDLQRVLRYRDANDPCPLQRHYSHPEHGFVADIDIVFAHERQLAVIADAENRQASGEGLYCVAIPHIDRQIVLGDQQAGSIRISGVCRPCQRNSARVAWAAAAQTPEWNSAWKSDPALGVISVE